MLAEFEEENRRKLAEATLEELQLGADLSEASQSLRESLSELSVHSKSEKSTRFTNWVNNASSEAGNRSAPEPNPISEIAQVGGLQADHQVSHPVVQPVLTNTPPVVPPQLQSNLEQFLQHACSNSSVKTKWKPTGLLNWNPGKRHS